MKRLLLLLLLILVLGSLTLIQAPPVLAQGESEFASLNECLEETETLSVLFLVDTSGSLKLTDPTGARAVALDTAVSTLRKFESNFTVYVDFVEFGTITVRSFPELERWTKLSDSDGWSERIQEFTQRDDGNVTDYGAALNAWTMNRPEVQTGALDLLSSAPPSCKLLIWLSDGALDIWDGRARTIDTTSGEILIDGQGDEAIVEPVVINELCRPGGIVDQVRGSGKTVRDGRVFVVGVGLSDPGAPVDFELFEAVVAGSSNQTTCGYQSREPLGVFLNATVDELVNSIVEPIYDPICGRENQCKVAETFTLEGSLTSFNLLVVTGDDAVDFALLTPGPHGETVEIDGSRLVTLRNGVELDIDRISPTVILLSGVIPPVASNWRGDWIAQFLSPGWGTPVNSSLQLKLFGNLATDLLGSGDLRKGVNGSFTLGLTTAAGSIETSRAWTDSSQLFVTVGGETLATPTIDSAGSFHFNFFVPEDYDQDTLLVEVVLLPRVQFIDSIPPIELTQFTATYELEVAPLPTSPLIIAPAAFTSIDEQNLTAITSVTIDSSRPGSGGCVRFVSQTSAGMPPGMSGSPTVLVDGRAPSPDDCIVTLDDGETVTLDLTVALTADQLHAATNPTDNILELHVGFQSDSAQGDDLTPYSFTDLRVPVEVPTRTDARIQLLFPLLAASLLAPALLLYAFNYFVGSQIGGVSDLVVADLDVHVSSDGIVRPGYSASFLRAEDFHSSGGASSPGRAMTIHTDRDIAQFKSRISKNLFGAPTMLGQLIGDSRPTLGSKGSTNNQRQGKSEPSLARTWLLAADPPASAGETDQSDDVLDGESLLAARLVVFVPGNVTDFGPVIDGIQEELMLAIDRFRSDAATTRSMSSKAERKAEPRLKRKRKQTPRSGSDGDRPSATTVLDQIDSIATSSGRPKPDLNNIPE